tara:strand:- start:778 stop:999 length:222 start_codon:yes stop_codon:yes gene_type:complete
MKKLKKIRNDDVVNKLIAYQRKLYGGKSTVKLDDIKVECSKCKVYFSPSVYRAKKLMSVYGVINKCRECENDL